MEMRYDPYYEEELPYRMNLEELFERANRKDYFHIQDRDVLAYIRERGISFTCLAPASTPRDMLGMSPLGMMVGSRSELVPCKIYTGGLWNPLDESNTLHPGSFGYAHKIQVTPIEFEGCIETFYFSDFCSLISDGSVVLIELDTEIDISKYGDGAAV